MLSITAIYASLLALLLLVLTARVIRHRRSERVAIGDGGDEDLTWRIRAHANCAEYVPIGVVLLALVELQGAPGFAVHLLGIALLVGRILHGIGLSVRPQIMMLRVQGMLLTLIMIAVSALGLLVHAIF